jgi:tetratricopeptide (TPR) repeat protein
LSYVFISNDKSFRSFVPVKTMMKPASCAFAIAGVVCFVAGTVNYSFFPAAAWVNTDQTLEQAAECGERGDYASAVRLATEVIDQKPSYAMAYAVRGTVHRRSGEYSQAIADLDRAIELDSRNSDAYTQRAFACQQGHIRDSNQILADLNRAIELDATSALAHILRGNQFADLNDHDAAIANYDQAVRLNPRSYIALANRASSKLSVGQPDEARRDLQKAIELNPPAADRKQIEDLFRLVN